MQSLQNYCFSLLNMQMQIHDVLVVDALRLVHTCDAGANANARDVHTSNVNASTVRYARAFENIIVKDEIEVAFSVRNLGL